MSEGHKMVLAPCFFGFQLCFHQDLLVHKTKFSRTNRYETPLRNHGGGDLNIWGFLKMGVPLNHPSRVGLSTINQPFRGTPISGPPREHWWGVFNIFVANERSSFEHTSEEKKHSGTRMVPKVVAGEWMLIPPNMVILCNTTGWGPLDISWFINHYNSQ